MRRKHVKGKFLHMLLDREHGSDVSERLDNISPTYESAYVKNGGTFVILGVTDALTWLPWPVTYVSTGSGTSITIEDIYHPLLTSPNTLSSTVNFTGYFSEVWANFSILAPAADPWHWAGPSWRLIILCFPDITIPPVCLC